MAERRQRHARHDSPEEDVDYRKRDDRRHRERSRSPHQSYRCEEHPRDRDGFRGDDRSRVRDRDREQHRPHEYQRRDPHNYGDRSGMNRERRRGDYDARASDEHRMRGNGREGDGDRERFQTRGMGRGNERRGVPHPEDGRQRGRERMNERRQPRRKRSEEEDISNYEYGGGRVPSAEGRGGGGGGEEGEESGKEGGNSMDPDYALSGKLTADTNTFRGVVIKYNEPEEARIPKIRWRLYQFKGDETLPTLYIHRQSAYLVGRERKICDMPVDHPSCSKQHAVIQYRLVNYTKADGSTGRRVRPYVIDLESTNGTYVNNQRIESARYYELREKDMLKFGFSSREYILLNENSKEDEDDEPDPLSLSGAEEEEQVGGVKMEGSAVGGEGGSGESDIDSSSSEKAKKHKKKKKKKRSHKT